MKLIPLVFLVRRGRFLELSYELGRERKDWGLFVFGGGETIEKVGFCVEEFWESELVLGELAMVEIL